MATARPSMVEEYKREFVFKRLVDYLNYENSQGNGPKVTTSMARQLRELTQQSMFSMSLRKNGGPGGKYSLYEADGSLKSPEGQAAANMALAQVRPFAVVTNEAVAWHVLRSLSNGPDGPVKGIEELSDAWRETYTTDDGKTGARFRKIVYDRLAYFDKQFEDMYADGVIPISPYAPDVCFRDAFMDSGMDCLYAKRSEVEAAPNVPISVQLNEHRTKLFKSFDDARSDDAAKKALPDDKVVTKADRSGFARLRPYLSSEDYQAIVHEMSVADTQWNMRQDVFVRNGVRVDGASRTAGAADYMAARAARLAALRRDENRTQVRGGHVVLERAEAILRTLRDEGIPFKVSTNAYDGQVVLDFGNKMQLRLIDAENPGMSGLRMYQNGRVMFLKTDARAYDRKLSYALSFGKSLEEAYRTSDTDIAKLSSNTKYVPHLDATPEEAVAFVKYCLGQPVQTFGPNQRVAGSPAPMSRIDDKHVLYPSAHSGNHFYADMGSFVSDSGQSYALCVDYASTDRRGSEVTYQADGTAAREWLETSINTAVYNFKTAVDLDYLVETFKSYRESGDETMMPVFSMDPDIAYIQRQYWDILTGAQETLVRPGHDLNGDDGDLLRDATYGVESDGTNRYVTFDGVPYSMDFDEADPASIPAGRVEMITRHLSETIEYNFGSFERTGIENKRFNPAYVARFMTSSNSLYRNIDDIVVALRAYMKDTMPSREGPPKIPTDTFDPSELRGDDFTTNSVRERLYVFDELNARPMDAISAEESPFLNRMYGVVKMALESNGCIVVPGCIEIDENGVVRYNVEEVFVGRLHKGSGEKYEDRHEVPAELLGNAGQYTKHSGSDWIHTRSVTGYIGRILEPNADGMVFDGTYYHAPGYTATIRPNRFGEDAPYEARMVLTGYEQAMANAIRNRIRSDTLDGKASTGDTTGIDNVLRHLYDIRYGKDFYERSAEDGMSPELRSAIVKTNTQRVKLDSDLMDSANRVAVYSAVADVTKASFSPYVDNDMSPVTLTGGRNVAINESPGDGFFDPRATGNGGAQGVRYLVDGAVVNLDGSITPAEIAYTEAADGTLVKDLSKLPRCALSQYLEETGRMSDYDAVDRANMTLNGLLHCMRETDRVGVAQMSFGGWTLEDGLVVSKRFADTYMVPDANRPGQHRSLMAGDKIECHGNKGVISIVIDPDMSDEDAQEQGILEQVRWMRANPELDVVMAPYSHVSRFNSGLGAEAMGLGLEAGVDAEHVTPPKDLIAPDGTVMKGSLGHVKLTILEQTADVKTHFEEDGSPKRSYGAQAGWAMAAADCPNLLMDSFEDNTKSLMELRELLITCGMDLSADGRLLRGYHAQPGETRNIIPVEPLIISKAGAGSRRVMKVEDTTNAFMENISMSGGFVEIPFRLEFPRFNVDKDFEFAEGVNPQDGFAKSECDKGRRATVGFLEDMPAFDENGNRTFGSAVFGTTYKLPVMSAMMRSGQEFEDGKAIYHDWSNAYRNIYNCVAAYQAELYKMMHGDDKFYIEQSVQYADRVDYTPVNFEGWLAKLEVEERARNGGQLLPRSRDAGNLTKGKPTHKDGTPWRYLDAVAARDAMLASYQQKAQAEFDRITSDVVERKLESKHNIFRAGIMANKQVNSATAIWTGDPRLKIDEVGMNPDMMKALGVKDGEYVMLHRDPVLRDGGMRYMKAVADPRLAGISVNPAGIPKCMDGDFDGDTIGVHKPGSEAACREAMANLSVYSNLLDCQNVDKSSWNEDRHRYDRRRLFIAGGQDIAAGLAANPELQRKYDMIELAVNKFENAALDGKISEQDLARSRMWATNEINSFLTDCYDHGLGRNIISYDSPQAHLQSCLDYVNDGAKGSPKKVAMYAANMGLDVKFDADKTSVMSVEKLPNGVYSEDVRRDNIGILQAKNMQTQYTGFGGMFSIRAVRALYNVDPKAALELTYVATQAVLQVKHDAAMADKYEQILSGPARWVWQGYKLEEVENTEKLRAVQPSGKYQRDGKTGAVSEKLDFVEHTVPKTWRIAKDENGNRKMATRAEFVEQFKAVYGEGMDLFVNDQFVHRVADLLCTGYNPQEPVPENPAELKAYRARLDKSEMMSIEQGAVERYGAPLQRLAYGAKLKDVAQIATENQGLFDVPTERMFGKNYNGCMADAGIMRKNIEAMKQGQPPVEIIAQQDVLAEGQRRTRRALMGSKMVEAVHSRGFKAEATRIDNRPLNASSPFAGQQPVKPEPVPVAVRTAAEPVPGPFGVPAPAPAAEAKPVTKPAQEPIAPSFGMVFPTGGRNGDLTGMDLSSHVQTPAPNLSSKPSPAPVPVPAPQPVMPDVPPEFLSQIPPAYPHERDIPEADELDGGDMSSNPNDWDTPPW